MASDSPDGVVREGDSVARSSTTTWPVALDVLAVFAYLLIAVGDVWVQSGPVPLRAALGIPLVLFLPGYAVLSALFPARGARLTDRSRPSPRAMRRPDGLAWRDRVALSFGLSLAVVPLLALVLAAVGWGFSPPVVASALGVVIGLGIGVGGVRRSRLPDADRYRVPARRWIGEVRGGLVADEPLDAALNVALLAAAVLAVSALAFALVAPPSAEAYSGFQLLTEDGGGELVAADYPREFAPGEARSLYVGIDNHEGTTTDYTVVAEVQRVDTDGGGVTVRQRERVDRFTVTLAPGERLRDRRSVAPELTGRELRLVFYLYRDGAPADPDRGSAYRTVYVWIDVGDTA